MSHVRRVWGLGVLICMSEAAREILRQRQKSRRMKYETSFGVDFYTYGIVFETIKMVIQVGCSGYTGGI